MPCMRWTVAAVILAGLASILVLRGPLAYAAVLPLTNGDFEDARAQIAKALDPGNVAPPAPAAQARPALDAAWDGPELDNCWPDAAIRE